MVLEEKMFETVKGRMTPDGRRTIWVSYKLTNAAQVNWIIPESFSNDRERMTEVQTGQIQYSPQFFKAGL